MALVEDHDVIQTLAANRTDLALDGSSTTFATPSRERMRRRACAMSRYRK
jgi:hypothetical protein